MAHYEGTPLTVQWLPDGRRMQVADPFAFIDGNDLRWDVPGLARIDGASIPQFLWSIVGSPYTEKYRDASVVHDYYCSLRTRTAAATHRMFLEGMLVSGVEKTRANLMYAAVKYAGPRWSDLDSYNANLASEGRWAAPYAAPVRFPGAGTTASVNWDGRLINNWGPAGPGVGPTSPVDLKPAWAPTEVSAEGFAFLANDILEGMTDVEGIDAEFDADHGNSDYLPDGLFPFGDESPLEDR